jgi:hypothetical protein
VAPRAWDGSLDPAGRRGLYRRRIRLVNDPEHPGRSFGELEDDFHHFRVDISHADGTITGVSGTGVRGPWTTCMDAGVKLAPLVGQPVSLSSTAVGDYTDARQNCTHMFDLAGLVVAQAARNTETRQYDMEFSDRRGAPSVAQARIWRDGALVLEWALEDEQIAAPVDWVGAPIHDKFIVWAEANLDPDLAEAAIALKRIVNISLGRTMIDLDELELASDIAARMHGACHTYQQGNAAVAIRHKGSARDFTDTPGVLLSDMHLR